MKKKATTRRVRIPTVTRVARRHGHLLVRYAGKEYVLVPRDEIARIEDETDVREARRVLARVKRGSEKTIPYEQVRPELGLD